MIYVTGDTHGLIDIAKIERFYETEGKNLTRDDYLIVLGDFGICWLGHPAKNTQIYRDAVEGGFLDHDDQVRSFWAKMPWTTLFIDGNHENFHELESYPVEEWNGGQIHKIQDNVFHLMRGQIFNIDGKSFFTLGGAQSTDRIHRIEGETWWPEELPNTTELGNALDKLEAHGMKVDYVLTHCCPEKYVSNFMASIQPYHPDRLTNFLGHLVVDWGLEFQHWYFGHYHRDMDSGRFHSMFNTVRPIAPLLETSVTEEEKL